jgi:hypothetical protein
MDDTIVLMGGRRGPYFPIAFNDVWKSNSRGDKWTLVTSTAEWSGKLMYKLFYLALVI